ncbi:MAG: helix-turn-helix transcriptional regulator [Colwellia sp.]|nr:helix-turn-helix transcriptional regulator [Colwellia sp.]
MAELADRIGLCAGGFKYRFKQATNENSINYSKIIDVEQVKDKLEMINDAINYIIFSVGYENISILDYFLTFNRPNSVGGLTKTVTKGLFLCGNATDVFFL